MSEYGYDEMDLSDQEVYDDMSEDEAAEFENAGYDYNEDFEGYNEDEHNASMVVLKKDKRTFLDHLGEISNALIASQSAQGYRESMLTKLKQKLKEQQDDLEEDDVQFEWELTYDENYDRTLDELMKMDKSKDYNRHMRKTTKLTMRKIHEEWKQDTELVSKILESVTGRKLTRNSRLSRDEILQVFNRCSDCFEPFVANTIRAVEFDNNIELNWIEQWKEPTYRGGKGVVVNGSTFSGFSGISQYRLAVYEAFNESVRSGNISTQLKEMYPEDVLSASKGSALSLLDTLKQSTDENSLFGQVGQVIVRPSVTTIKDFEDMLMDIGNNEYDVDDLVNDIQDKMKFVLDESDVSSLTNNVKRIVNSKSSKPQFLKDIFYDTQNKPVINIRKGLSTEIDSLTVLMEDLALGNVSEGVIDDDNFLASGIQTIDGVVMSTYSQNVQFIKPYKDPHFTFLGETVEMWTPKVHLVTGLPVFSNTKEVLKMYKTGRIVYIKPQSVTVTYGTNKTDLIYFRKFINFVDYLKAWQETYARKYFEISHRIETGCGDIGKCFRIINERKRLVNRIRSIKNYFISELQKETDETVKMKLEIFLSDEIVDTAIRPNEQFDHKMIEKLDRMQSSIIAKYNSIPSSGLESLGINDLVEHMRNLKDIKSTLKYYISYFSNDKFSAMLLDTTKEVSISKVLFSKFQKLHNEIQQTISGISPSNIPITKSDLSKTLKDYKGIISRIDKCDQVFIEGYLLISKWIQDIGSSLGEKYLRDLRNVIDETVRDIYKKMLAKLSELVKSYKNTQDNDIIVEFFNIIDSRFFMLQDPSRTLELVVDMMSYNYDNCLNMRVTTDECKTKIEKHLHNQYTIVNKFKTVVIGILNDNHIKIMSYIPNFLGSVSILKRLTHERAVLRKLLIDHIVIYQNICKYLVEQGIITKCKDAIDITNIPYDNDIYDAIYSLRREIIKASKKDSGDGVNMKRVDELGEFTLYYNKLSIAVKNNKPIPKPKKKVVKKVVKKKKKVVSSSSSSSSEAPKIVKPPVVRYKFDDNLFRMLYGNLVSNENLISIAESRLVGDPAKLLYRRYVKLKISRMSRNGKIYKVSLLFKDYNEILGNVATCVESVVAVKKRK